MKTNALRIALLTAFFLIAASVSLQAAPSLPITEPPVVSTHLDGPPQDPGSTNGQWFLDLDTGAEEYRDHEFYDNVYGEGGGVQSHSAIYGKVSTVLTDATGAITYFEVAAAIHNDTPSTEGQWADGSNSHEEMLSWQENYVGTLIDTKLTAEFAIADMNTLPGSFTYPYQNPYLGGSYIIAENETQLGWYCWNELEVELGETGKYYVPAWDFGDIATNSVATLTLQFSVSPPMNTGDPRYQVIMNSYTGEPELEDIFASRTTSLKISTWIDDLMTDTGIPYPDHPLRGSDVSVFHNTEQEPGDEYDFGDAPDPLAATPGEYPTLLANNGARHMIVAGAPWFGDSTWSETDQPDGEPDGQPDPSASGDDSNGTTPDDEDGIVIPVMTPGFSSSITINVGAPGWVDGWIDWNADGKWGAAERIIGQVLPAGANNIIINTPNGASTGFTFARFRIHTADGIALGPIDAPSQFGAVDDGEVEDHLVEIVDGPFSDAKWLQPPDLTPNGFDVACRLEGDPPILLADDFLCTNHCAITNIVVWGSWLGDELPENSPSNVSFTLSFHADRPAGTAQPWSIPGTNLWTRNFGPGQFSAEPITFDGMQEGWYDPTTGQYTPNADWTCWQYTFPIDILDAFVQTGTVENPVVYWLDVQANPHDPQQLARFGWKTTPPEYRWNDDAAWTPNIELYNGINWFDMHYPPGHPYEEWETNSFDLAFALFCGPEEEETLDWGDAPDPAYPTLAASLGANHLIVPGLLLGAIIDAEGNGQPNATATGDDLANLPDEDGVTFATPLIPGATATINVTASAAGLLDAWIDYNGDGIWTPAEQLGGASIALVAGNNAIAAAVPASAIPTASTFARFRFSSLGGLQPTGSAPDGEVEDYEVSIDELDFGDAPDPAYPTLSASSGASHLMPGGGPWLMLGSQIDGESDGQPTPLADGDDLTNLQDEDGVLFATPQLYPGTVAQITVLAGVNAAVSGFAYLDAWVDFNADGTWGAAEKIFTSQVLTFTGPATPTVLTFPVPSGSVAGPTFARFRLSTTATGLAPIGFASDGEVEDYRVDIAEEIPVDWGDLPAGYPVLAANNGAHHLLSSSLCFGSTADAEPDGQPSINADGDDTNLTYPGIPYPPGDEDGVIQTCSALMPGGYASVDVVASQPGILDAWIDFNLDTTWTQPGDQIFSSQPLGQGTNSLLFPVPLTASSGIPAHCRFRITSGSGAYPGGSASPTGLAYDGEVEDYHWLITAVPSGNDWGDAPDAPYPTLSTSFGAAHAISAGVMLGAAIDAEPDGMPTAAAGGDDTTGIDDEDGVAFTAKLVAGTLTAVQVVAGVSGGYLDAWIDYNADGDWTDPGEQIAAATLLSGGLNSLNVSVPQPCALGPTFARFRITSTAGGLSPDNAGLPPFTYPDGEVEDYLVDLYQPAPTNLVITSITVTLSNELAKIEWTAGSNIIYQMQSSSNLLTNVWTDAGSQVIGPVNWQTNSAAPMQQFYRVTAPWTP